MRRLEIDWMWLMIGWLNVTKDCEKTGNWLNVTDDCEKTGNWLNVTDDWLIECY